MGPDYSQCLLLVGPGVLHILDSGDDEGIVRLTAALPKADLRFSHSETEKSNYSLGH
jgi:hypothetical protein